MRPIRRTRHVDTYVEFGVGMASDGDVAAWVFDLDVWGRCGQGADGSAAVADLAAQVRGIPLGGVEFRVVERIDGDEQAFDRDRVPATEAERAATLAILAEARAGTLALLAACPDELLDFDNPQRRLPSWARWRTLREMFWHVADTDCRYYLPSLGLEARPRADDLDAEMAECAAHVRRVVGAMPLDHARRDDQGEWTSTKVLRRLGWHERGELRAMRDLAVVNAGLLGLRVELPPG